MTQDWYDALELRDHLQNWCQSLPKVMCYAPPGWMGLLPTSTRARRKVMDDSKGLPALKKGYSVLLFPPLSALTCTEMQSYPSHLKMPTLKTLPLFGIGCQYKWHHEKINYAWVNVSAITHRALFTRTNDMNLRCKEKPVRRLRDFSSINSKLNSKPKNLKQLVNPRLPKHHIRGTSEHLD